MKEKLYFIISMIIFGAAGIFAKHINMSSSKIALSLSLAATAFLIFIFICKKQTISLSIIRKNLTALTIAGIALSGNWIFLFQSYKKTTIANAALSYYCAPVLVILFSPLILKEKLSTKQIICVVTALFGLFLILQNSAFEATGVHLLGICYGIIAASFYATLTLTNKFIRGLNNLTITILQLSLSTMVLLPFVYFTEGVNLTSLTNKTILLILLFGLLHGCIGFYMFFSGIKGLKAQNIAILSYIDPLTSILISILVVKENFTILQLIGTILLLGSIWISETYKTS